MKLFFQAFFSFLWLGTVVYVAYLIVNYFVIHWLILRVCWPAIEWLMHLIF